MTFEALTEAKEQKDALAEFQLGHLCSMYYNAHAKQNDQRPPAAFMPSQKWEKPQQTVEDMRRILESLC